MPNDNPLVGEVWEHADATGRNIRGIVADVTSTMATLVSFTGNRFRIAPARLISTWRFSQAPPPTALRCSRRGCPHAGILRYSRGPNADWVCARHLPVGVQASLTTESLGRPAEPSPAPRPAPAVTDVEWEEVPAVRCLRCGNPDPVEDTRVTLPSRTSLWTCPLCSDRWCYIFTRPLPPGADEERALFDVLNEVRVALTMGNFTIQEIAASNAVWRVVENEVLATGGTTTPGSPLVVYAGLPFRNNPAFSLENPAHALLRLNLTGGPDFRRPEPTPLQVARAEGMNENFRRLYGPQAALDEVDRRAAEAQQGAQQILGEARNLLSQLQGGQVHTQPNPEANGLLAEMNPPPPFVGKGTRWVERSTGDLVEVSYLDKATDGDTVVHFKRVSDNLGANAVLLQRDFETLFRPYTVEPTRSEPVIEILKDQEWEHVESGEVVRIDNVDTKRNLVTVEAKDKRRSVPMLDFVNAKWRKVVRKTLGLGPSSLSAHRCTSWPDTSWSCPWSFSCPGGRVHKAPIAACSPRSTTRTERSTQPSHSSSSSTSRPSCRDSSGPEST